MPLFPRSRSHILRLGVPFFGAMLLATYGMAHLAQTRYDYHDKKTKLLAKKEQLQLDADRKPFSVQEAYWNLTSKKEDWDDWDMVRVPRPPGDE
ncbi:uncharacterized protein SPPG_09099 [Spizellomyces punctatus DAOM BR117]|uniref:Cytochrome c oxidase assembly protein COX16, mitochondrial n=1 Tax=Spizellomyces punctatus (strain DAOM BR117) TaxID=645134 RepID=A0A0L0HIX3_SPIPD|nr:uncharacterized protein SPPG_09099 [Spizellomyces punctatus DAOM BR117]KND01411.1 hypothetical protein SPPG_09099 [Spizellomyces punctatus DAOM BR117]|eukprot:XP_016609450.1 hypothetical protein SPPG_09099 [Spizellomyces punctatus DAOM BR117]